MQRSDRVSAYLESVCEQIRWKRARSPVLQEIEDHITDQKNAYMEDGLDERTATDKAIEQMGDPVALGRQLDRAHRPGLDWSLVALTSAMLVLGFVAQSLAGSKGAWLLGNQMAWAGVSVPVMIAAYLADFTFIGRYPRIVFLLLCAATIGVFALTETVHGVSVYAVNPLLLSPLAFSGLVYSMRDRGYSGIALCGVAFAGPACLALLVPSLTLFLLLCVTCLIIVTGAISRGWFGVRKSLGMLLACLPAAFVLATLVLMAAGAFGAWYAHSVLVIVDPSVDPAGAGFMGTLIRQLLSHSRFIGTGTPITGAAAYELPRILPEIGTDYILTYLIYRLGWIVLIVVAGLLAAFMARAMALCRRQKSTLGYLTALAVTSSLAAECVIYVVSNLGFAFSTSMSLPLISFGGRALVTNMLLIGLLLAVSRTGALVRDEIRTPC